MNCDKAIQEMVDVLTGATNTPRSDELEKHLSSCQRCREELRGFEQLWTNLERLDSPTMSPSVAKEMLLKLQTTPTPKKRSLPTTLVRRFGIAASIVLSLAAGAMISRSEPALALFPMNETPSEEIQIANETGGGVFLFLLHRPNGNLPGRRAQRYAQWANDLRDMNQLVRAGALHDTQGWLLTRPNEAINATPIGDVGVDGTVEGFFLITAPDSAAVVNAARISPHFDYGGTIEVRRVVN